MEYYRVLKEENLAIFTTWLDPEDIMLNKISQAQKDKYYTVSFHVSMRNLKKANAQKQVQG
jgi:hypothetical protein